MQAKYAVTINRSPEELYRFWRDYENLSRFMSDIESVTRTEAGGASGIGEKSHWVARGPGGSRVEWDAEVVDDRPGELIAWHSIGDSSVDHVGEVRFVPEPGGRGTILAVSMNYDPPGGILGTAVAKLSGHEPNGQLKVDLRRLKQLMELGELVTTQGQPAGRDSSTSKKYDSAVRTQPQTQTQQTR